MGSKYGQGLNFTNDKYLIGKQSFAIHLNGVSGGAGQREYPDYFIAFLNNKLFLVYEGVGSGMSLETTWSSEYSFVPSNNDIFNMKISYEEYKTINGKPNKKSTKNTIYSFSHQEKKYIEIVK